MSDGSLLACWFHGTGERTADDVSIQGARLPARRIGWSARFEMADTPGYPDCNPVLFIDPEGRLWMYWITVLANLWESSLLKYRISSNYTQPGGPPVWEWQDNIHITPTQFPKI
jgi:predicted neuraminidase